MAGGGRAVRLGALARAAGDLLVAPPAADVSVTGISFDSSRVAPGNLFFCIPGTRRDGHEFAPAAMRAGAAALCVSRPLGLGAPEIVVADARRAMGRIAAAFFGRPADDLLVAGVTGTNGKTTTAYLLESILRAAGHRTGLIGTIETRVGGDSRPGVRTTPESADLQELLATMVGAGVTAVAMEVTSHALTLHRVEGMRLSAAGFTNLSQDHLDFHGGMEDYFAAKRSLFTRERAAAGAVNVDDAYGRRLADESAIPTIGYGRASGADVRPVELTTGPLGSEFVALTPAGDVKVSTSLVGGFNVMNCLAACAVALQAGIAPGPIEEGLAGVASVPGRLEAVDRGQPFAVVVDYAHTPASLDNVLREARAMAARAHGRVVCVFGCGGDRDRGKRPVMGAAAARLSDVVIVTSDNPRSEDPAAIIAAILEGVLAARPGGADHVIEDRREAIAVAVAAARAGDVVVIAGKGHETGQERGGVVVPFDDRVTAAEALVSLGWEGAR